MRGFGDTEKPAEQSAYALQHLASDINEIVKALGHETCTLVAHDWGGIVAWSTAHNYPAVVSRLVILNVPHPKAALRNMSFAQFLRSWYIFFFQLPWLPELMMRLNDYEGIAAGLLGKKMGVKDRTHVTKEDVEVYKYAISRPNALTSALNYYRNMWREPQFRVKTVACPTLVLWGEEDQALGKELNTGLELYVPRLHLKYFPGVSHWIGEEKPLEVAEAMRAFLADGDDGADE